MLDCLRLVPVLLSRLGLPAFFTAHAHDGSSSLKAEAGKAPQHHQHNTHGLHRQTAVKSCLVPRVKTCSVLLVLLY